MNEFHCAMHPLDTIARESDKIIKHKETGALTSKQFPFTHKQESVTQATVRTFVKLFHTTQYLNEDIITYISQRFKDFRYYRFVGNRFHVYFLNSGLLYSYRSFYTTVSKPKNPLEAAIFNALSTKIITENLQALGLFGKIVTGPWMRLVGKKT